MRPAMRLANQDDAEAILAIYAPAILAIYAPAILEAPASFEVEPPSVADMQQRIADVLKTYPWIVYQGEEQAIAGYAYANRHSPRAAYEWSVDTSVYVRVSSHRRGVGRALYASLLNLQRLQGYVNA